MKSSKYKNSLPALKGPSREMVRVTPLVLAICVSLTVLSGCWAVPPKVLTTPGNLVPVARVFPSALLAEPIQLRAGYVHTTQPFRISGPKERWAVALGFVRGEIARTEEEKKTRDADLCWVNSSKRNLRPETCKNVTPGFHLQWELLREDSKVPTQFEFDSLRGESGGTYSEAATVRMLSGFSGYPSGQYRLRITVLRDARELDFLKPHILVNRPFFSSRSIE